MSSETNIIKMLLLFSLTTNMYHGRIFQQRGGMPMGTYYAPILADSFLNSHEADFIQGLLKKNESRPPKITNLRIIVFLQNKMCPILAQGIYIYVGHYFLWNTVGLQVLLYTSLVCDHTYKVSCFGVFHPWTFPTERRYTYGYILCPYSRRPVP
jgi:hypothetical protein